PLHHAQDLLRYAQPTATKTSPSFPELRRMQAQLRRTQPFQRAKSPQSIRIAPGAAIPAPRTGKQAHLT
ncbi:hypothetical protein A2U01_0069052, partial [Trifolium medium]|nr:hypothetical protein [Trifolium medium]